MKSIFFKILEIRKTVLCWGIFLVIIPEYVSSSWDSQIPKSNQQQPSVKNQFITALSFDIESAAPTDPRPDLPDSFLSANQRFMIHYTIQGKDAVSAIDENSNQIPDRIEKIAAAFEKSYEVEVEEMQYRIPPSMNDGANPYQVYVLDLNNSFGRAIRISPDSTAWEQKDVCSYILFDNDFIGQGFHLTGDEAIKVTAAHEFFHAIQMGYVFRKIDAFFFELSAVWMEDQVFDEVDNYLYYLDYFFSAPEIPLNGVSFTIPNVIRHIYGDCIFAFYLVENYGEDIIKQIWQLMPEMPAIEAMDKILKNLNTSFKQEFVKFCMWNYFTGTRANPDFSYDSGVDYPEIKIKDRSQIEYYYQTVNSGYFLTAAYYVLQPVENSTYNVYFSTEWQDHWRLGVIIRDAQYIRTNIIKPGQGVTLEEVASGQEIVAIACNTNHLKDPMTIYFKEAPEQYSFYLTKEISNRPVIVKSFEIINIAPNPFSGSLKISLKKIGTARLKIKMYNLNGQLVADIFDSELNNETNDIFWDVQSVQTILTSGVYFLKFSDGHAHEVRKILFTK